MYSFIKRLVYRVLIAYRYRNVKFKYEGIGSSLKAFNSSFVYPEKIHIGDHVHIGSGAMLDGAGGISINEGSILAPDVKIYSRTHNFDHDLQSLPFDNVVWTAPVNVGRYVWIGTGVIILPGVNVGEGAVIGAGAVVAKDVPACAVVVGNPARVIKFRDSSRFQELARESSPFVYEKYGHAKVFKEK